MNVQALQLLRKFQSRLPEAFHPKRVQVNLPDGKTLTLSRPFSSGIGASIVIHSRLTHEEEMLGFFRKALSCSSTFFDVGANIGYYSLIAYLYNPNVQVYSFEPAPKVFEALRENVRTNDGVERIHYEQIALTDFDSVTDLYIPQTGDLEASTLEGFRPNTRTVSVRAMTLDSYCPSTRSNPSMSSNWTRRGRSRKYLRAE